MGARPAASAAGRAPVFPIARMTVDQEAEELVMFDFDGVIVDSLDVFSTAFIDACTAAGVPGFTTTDDLLAVMEDNFYAGMRARGVETTRASRMCCAGSATR